MAELSPEQILKRKREAAEAANYKYQIDNPIAATQRFGGTYGGGGGAVEVKNKKTGLSKNVLVLLNAP